MPYKRIKTSCSACGKEIMRPYKHNISMEARKGLFKFRYCSRKCQYILLSKQRKERAKEHYRYWTCKECGKKFSGILSVKRKYCSASCATVTANKRRSKWNKLPYEKIIKEYRSQPLTITDMANKYNVSFTAMRKMFKERGIKPKSLSVSLRIGIHRNIEKYRKAMLGSKNPMYGRISYSKAVFIPRLGHCIRSSWEKDIAEILRTNKIPYKYEGITFKVNNGKNTYSPDFVIGKKLIEVKGMLFDSSKEKMIQLKKQYPEFELIIVGNKNPRFNPFFADKYFGIFQDKHKKEGRKTKWTSIVNKEKANELITYIKG